MLSAVVAFALAGSIVGCTPQSTPSPVPSSSSSTFSSDAEAFAAAEATYRAYVDATNAKNNGSSEGPSPSSFLVDSALDGELNAEQQFRDKGISLTGEMRIMRFTIQALSPSSIQALVCLDVAATRVVDSSGRDVTPGDRARTLALLVTFSARADSILISDSQAVDHRCE